MERFTFADNPACSTSTPATPRPTALFARIEDDGRYEVVTLPGRGLIACRSDLGRYRGGVGAEAIKGYDPKDGYFSQHDSASCVFPAIYHVLAEVNIDPKAESATVDLQVDPGRSLTIDVVDPEGKPVGGTKVSGFDRPVLADRI